MCVVFCFYFWFAYVCGVVFNLFFMARPVGRVHFIFVFCMYFVS